MLRVTRAQFRGVGGRDPECGVWRFWIGACGLWVRAWDFWGFRVYGLGLRILGVRVYGLGPRILGVRDWSLGFKAWGLG